MTISKKEIRLERELREYVVAFDFRIVKDLPPSKIIEEHRQTRFFAARFNYRTVLGSDH